jgi:hypothetical protein
VSEPAQAIEKRDRLSQIERVLGTGDMKQMIEATKANVNAAIQFAREREFVSEYPIVKNGRQVGTRLWFHHPTWQLLGQSFGVTAYTDGEPKEVKPGTWQASAVAALIEDGRVIGRSVGLCSKSEPGKSGAKGPPATDHTLAAIAQARAQRNALRSALGAVLIAAGFEISDPEGPATKEQVGMLHQLERELGFDHEMGHRDAGVDSYKELTREQASEVIDRWQKEVDRETVGDSAVSGSAGANHGEASRGNDSSPAGKPGPERSADPQDPSSIAHVSQEEETGASGEAPSRQRSRIGEGAAAPQGNSPEDPSLDQPASEEQWQRARSVGLTSAKALRKARERWGVTKDSDITRGQLAELLEEHLG